LFSDFFVQPCRVPPKDAMPVRDANAEL